MNTYGERTDYYDANDHHYVYAYSTNGDLNSVTTPLGNETQWGHDALGVVTSRIDALSRTTTYTPDAWERIVTVTYPDSSTHTFAFDQDSNLTSFEDGTGTTTRAYDGDCRLTSESKGGSTIVSHTYDATGKKGLLSTTTDANSRVITFSYDSLNRLSGVSETAGSTSYSYDAASNQTGITNPNGTTVTNTFDDAGGLTEVQNKNSSGTMLSSFSYVLDADGRRASVTEADGSMVSYGYDWGSRLTSETRTGTDPYTITYTLDPVGNRTSQSVTSGGSTATTNFTLDNDDQLNSTSSSTGGFVNSYSYNANGEQTGRTLSGTSSTLAFDYDGQLTSITTGSAVTSFAYDALGRRVSRTNGGTTTNFYLDGSRPLLEEQSGTITATYTYGTNLIRKDGEYPLFDGLGSERTVTNSSQTVTGTLVMDSFGNKVGSTGSSTNPYMFAATSGYRNDWDNGLTLVGARYYDSQVGRFITRDTDLEQKPYLYCEHDPVNKVDPSGHDFLDWLKRKLGISKPPPPPPTNQPGFEPSGGWPSGDVDDEGRINLDPKKTNPSKYIGYLGGAVIGVALVVGVGIILCCFDADTPVLMANGSVEKIQNVHSGEWVLSWDVSTHKMVHAQVLRTTTTMTEGEVTLCLPDGEKIRTTANHLFWVPDKGFVPAGKIAPLTQCKLSSGMCVTVAKVEWDTVKIHQVYNLEVNGSHTFFVGNAGICVHDVTAPMSR